MIVRRKNYIKKALLNEAFVRGWKDSAKNPDIHDPFISTANFSVHYCREYYYGFEAQKGNLRTEFS